MILLSLVAHNSQPHALLYVPLYCDLSKFISCAGEGLQATIAYLTVGMSRGWREKEGAARDALVDEQRPTRAATRRATLLCKPLSLEKLLIRKQHRSPRWSSGYPRMLLALVLESESRHGDILNLVAKIKKGSTAESA